MTARTDAPRSGRARPEGGTTLARWLRGTPAAWRTGSGRRTFALYAVLGALGDLATTSTIGHVPGVAEANPLSAAGQAVVGSVPGYMVATTVLVLGLLSVLPLRPVDVATRVVWGSVAVLATAKIGVFVANLVVLQGAVGATIDRV